MAEESKPALLEEIGRTGLNQSSGYIYEEYQPEWKGSFKNRTIRRMMNNSTCGAVIFGIDMLLRQVSFSVKPASEDNKDREAADFIEGCRHDMSVSWPDLISEIQSFLPWGWDYHEVCYKERRGENPGVREGKPLPSSKYNDGKIGWRKWAIRSQESLDRWRFDDEGGVSALIQNPPPDYQSRTIPIDKALLFRTTVHKGNPEGESIFRRAWESYYFLKNIARIEAIGVERDLAGLPEFWVPLNVVNPQNDNDRAANAAFKQIGRNIRNDEEACLLMPQIFDASGNKLYDFKLSGTNGTRLFDTDKIIQRYKHEILMASLADFLMLGAQQVGSYALSADKTELFTVALKAWLDSMCGVINRHAIPRLLRLNAYPTEKVPELVAGKVERMDLKTFLAITSELTKLNLVLSDEQINYILKMIDEGFPAQETPDA